MTTQCAHKHLLNFQSVLNGKKMCERKQVTLVTALARPPDTFGCSQPAHKEGLGEVISFCACLRKAAVSREGFVCHNTRANRTNNKNAWGSQCSSTSCSKYTFASLMCLQAAGLSTTFHCCFRAARAAAISPPTPSPGALHHFKACCASFYPSSFFPPTQAQHRSKPGM